MFKFALFSFASLFFSATSFAVTISSSVASLNISVANQKALSVAGSCVADIKVKLYVIDAANKSTTVVSADCISKKFSGVVDASSVADGKVRIKASQVVNGASQIVYANVIKDTKVVALSILAPLKTDSVTTANSNAMTVSGTCTNLIPVKLYVNDEASKYATTVQVDCMDNKFSGVINPSSLQDGALRIKASQYLSSAPTNFYVTVMKDTGSDSIAPAPSRFAKVAAGTITVKVKTIAEAEAAIAKAAANTTIVLPAGKFTSPIAIFSAKNGTANRPIILQGDAKGGTILTGKIKLTMQGNYLLLKNLNFDQPDSQEYSGSGAVITVDSCQYCGVQNIKMLGSPAAVMSGANDTKHFKYIRIKQTAFNFEISNSTFKGKLNAGSVILIERPETWNGSPDGHRIFNNLFSDRELKGYSSNDFDTIRIGSSTGSHAPTVEEGEASLARGNEMMGTLVEFNVFENTKLEASDAKACASGNTDACSAEPEIISVKSPQNVLRFNTFRNNYGGLTLRHGHQNLAEGNFFSGKNIPRGINDIYQYSYGIRIIGSDALVVNNHMQDLYTKGTMLGGISMVAGQTNAGSSDYWQVENAVVAMNHISNVGNKPISLASDYGHVVRGKKKDLPPINSVVSSNGAFVTGAVIDNQGPNENFIASLIFNDFYYSGSKIGVTSISGTKLTLKTSDIAGRGFSAPTNSELVGPTGILRSSASKRAALIKSLKTVSSSQSAAIIENMMKFLKLTDGTVYEKYSPLLPSEVGSTF